MAGFKRCTATTKAGNPCQGRALKNGLCLWHDPEMEAERQAARASGGSMKTPWTEKKTRWRKYKTRADVKEMLGDVANMVYEAPAKNASLMNKARVLNALGATILKAMEPVAVDSLRAQVKALKAERQSARRKAAAAKK